MKKYIRTKDNKIFDTIDRYCKNSNVPSNNYNKYDEYNIVKESDGILDLIQIGDLIKITNNDNLIGG